VAALCGLAGFLAGISLGAVPSLAATLGSTIGAVACGALAADRLASLGRVWIVRWLIWHGALAAGGAALGLGLAASGVGTTGVGDAWIGAVLLTAGLLGLLFGLVLRWLGVEAGGAVSASVNWPILLLIAAAVGAAGWSCQAVEPEFALPPAMFGAATALALGSTMAPRPGVVAWASAVAGLLTLVQVVFQIGSPLALAAAGTLAGAVVGEAARAERS
jgi:hypothetical protein